MHRKSISVHRAPEPDQIIWESIEISTLYKVLKRSITIFYLLLVYIFIYIAFSACAYLRVEYQNLLPVNGLCPRALPQLYTGMNAANVLTN